MDGTEKYFRWQHGLITHVQARAAKLTRRQVGYRLKQGVWEEVHPCVYRLASVLRNWEQDVMAAVLWAGPNAVASHGTAARLLKLSEFRSYREIHVMGQSRGHAPAAAVLHTGRVARGERESADRIPISCGVRTLIDLAAGGLEYEMFERTAEDAIRRKRANLARLAARHGARGRRQPGGRVLQRFLSVHRQQTESELEAQFLRVLREAGLPMPDAQQWISDGDGVIGRVDFRYWRKRLVVECDSYEFHSGRQSWSDDIERRSRLIEQGEVVLQVTWADVFERPRRLVQRIARLLGLTISTSATLVVAEIENPESPTTVQRG